MARIKWRIQVVQALVASLGVFLLLVCFLGRTPLQATSLVVPIAIIVFIVSPYVNRSRSR